MRNTLIKPEFLNIVSRFENDIDLLRQQCSETLNDPESAKAQLGENECNKQLKTAMELNKTISYTMFLPFINYYKFRKKCTEEGYTVQDGFNKLIEAYVENKIRILED